MLCVRLFKHCHILGGARTEAGLVSQHHPLHSRVLAYIEACFSPYAQSLRTRVVSSPSTGRIESLSSRQLRRLLA